METPTRQPNFSHNETPDMSFTNPHASTELVFSDRGPGYAPGEHPEPVEFPPPDTEIVQGSHNQHESLLDETGGY